MGRLALSLLLAFCFCANAASETIVIGDASVTYAVPAGFARAGELFPLDLKDMDKGFGLNTVVFAVLVPEEDIRIRQNDPRAIPRWYVHLAYDTFFSKHSINNAGFMATTWLIKNVIGKQYDSADFMKKLETVISGALNRKLKIHAMTQKGFVDDKPRYRSMLAYGNGELEDESGTEKVELATLTTFFMDQGKLVTIIQASRIESENDLPAFTEKALRIAEEITRRQDKIKPGIASKTPVQNIQPEIQPLIASPTR